MHGHLSCAHIQSAVILNPLSMWSTVQYSYSRRKNTQTKTTRLSSFLPILPCSVMESQCFPEEKLQTICKGGKHSSAKTPSGILTDCRMRVISLQFPSYFHWVLMCCFPPASGPTCVCSTTSSIYMKDFVLATVSLDTDHFLKF